MGKKFPKNSCFEGLFLLLRFVWNCAGSSLLDDFCQLRVEQFRRVTGDYVIDEKEAAVVTK